MKEQKTMTAMEVFGNLPVWKLGKLLESAGVAPNLRSKKDMIMQALIVWFHGNVPSKDTFTDNIEQYE
jgi:hypothetical protein